MRSWLNLQKNTVIELKNDQECMSVFLFTQVMYTVPHYSRNINTWPTYCKLPKCLVWGAVGDVSAAFGIVLWGQSWQQGVFIWPRVYIIDAHYQRHCHLQTLHGGRRCQVNVSLTSNGRVSQNSSVLPGVYLCDKWARLAHRTRSLSLAEKVLFY